MPRRLIFLFVDGLGLGSSNSDLNPLAAVHLPQVQSLLENKPLVAATAPVTGTRATLYALDACLGVTGLPQSATGQSVLLTGKNIPAELGYHYGPKPNPKIKQYLQDGNLFSYLHARGLRAELLNAYPPNYFQAIASGRRLYSAIPYAVTQAGIALKTEADLSRGQAVAADLTADGWHDHLGLKNTPLITAEQAGQRIATLAKNLDFAFFEYWLSDYAGHKRDKDAAVSLLLKLDQMLAGLISQWEDEDDLILVTSDHGNLENMSTRRHTKSPVPCLVIGSLELRKKYFNNLQKLTDVAPAILDFLLPSIPS